MFSWLNHNKVIYILSNLLVLPVSFIPGIDFLSNFSFFVAFFFLLKTNILMLSASCIVFLVKNNSNYRFNNLLRLKGEELSKSDYECVYLYAWCTLLRYFLIGLVVREINIFFR